jgi:hypothetical protein
MPRKKVQAPPVVPAVDEDDGVLDELQAWYLGLGERDGLVYTAALRQLVERMYRDRDYLAKRQRQGIRTTYDWAVERDQKALAWAIRAVVRYVPGVVKAQPEPPKPPRKPSRRFPDNAAPTVKQGALRLPKRDWDGPELPLSQEHHRAAELASGG